MNAEFKAKERESPNKKHLYIFLIAEFEHRHGGAVGWSRPFELYDCCSVTELRKHYEAMVKREAERKSPTP